MRISSAVFVAIFFAAGAGACARPAGASADEYAAWSLAIDEFAAADHRAVAVEDSTSDGPFGIRIEEETLRKFRPESVDPDLLEDFIARNREAAAVDAWRLAAHRVRVLPPLGPVAGRVESFVVPARVTLSRAGFSGDRRHALVSGFVRCGPMCGRGGMLLLVRGPDGGWRLEETLADYRS